MVNGKRFVCSVMSCELGLSVYVLLKMKPEKIKCRAYLDESHTSNDLNLVTRYLKNIVLNEIYIYIFMYFDSNKSDFHLDYVIGRNEYAYNLTLLQKRQNISIFVCRLMVRTYNINDNVISLKNIFLHSL